jgi:hypothetical protein
MTCPACHGPVAVPACPGSLIVVCAWCAGALVVQDGALRCMTADERARLPACVTERLDAITENTRLFGALRRN